MCSQLYNFYVTHTVDNTRTQFHFSHKVSEHTSCRFVYRTLYFILASYAALRKRTEWNFYFEVIFFDYFYAFFGECEITIKTGRTLKSSYGNGNFFLNSRVLVEKKMFTYMLSCAIYQHKIRTNIQFSKDANHIIIVWFSRNESEDINSIYDLNTMIFFNSGDFAALKVKDNVYSLFTAFNLS